MKEIYKMRKANDMEGLMELQDSLENQARKEVAKEPALKFTPEQIKAYTTVGGLLILTETIPYSVKW